MFYAWYSFRNVLNLISFLKLSLVSAAPGRVTYKMEVSEEHLNPGMSLHGGLTATLVDHVSTMAMVAADNSPGVSVDMNIRYLLLSISLYIHNDYFI